MCDGTALDDGCLFTVTGGDTPDPDDGFAVTNAYDVPLWDFVKARDLDALGYPVSRRWTDGPFTLQAFQKVILQWHPGKRQMNYFNTLDALANRYPEIELPFVPAHQVLEAESRDGLRHGDAESPGAAGAEPGDPATLPGRSGLAEPLRAADPV